MLIGEPRRPYFLDIDTGSNLTWLECQAGKGPCTTCNKVPHRLYTPTPDKLVPCADPLCDTLHQDLGTTKNCRDPPGQCSYEVTYLDGSSLGVLLLDKFPLPRLGGTDNNYPTIAFGCGYDQVGDPNKPETVAVDGILGLGRGSVGMVSQLKQKGSISYNSVAHCLSTKGGGYLYIGAELDSSQVTWVPMAPATPGRPNYYSPGQATLYLDTTSIGTKSLSVIFDSGITIRDIRHRIHDMWRMLQLEASLSKSLKVVSDPALALCWEGPSPFRSVEDLKKEFESLVSLKFDSGVSMMIPPENYLIITERGNACFGILPLLGLDMYLIGDITMQDQLVIYDNEKGMIGWMPPLCDKEGYQVRPKL
ncbi:Aspartic proteinase Asp1 [Dichanthelium oligosanthes]|uniref:Aspartic proteinase Asp1 n=1 Tax=Dichanthelium oligosanthes TaxID=888268 RepID=A0A1E5W777_9POAL|nr:Aspartic proteinase Asp1 [Dichanthelium oligosanthes]